jgi:hypothetical protein
MMQSGQDLCGDDGSPATISGLLQKSDQDGRHSRYTPAHADRTRNFRLCGTSATTLTATTFAVTLAEETKQDFKS